MTLRQLVDELELVKGNVINQENSETLRELEKCEILLDKDMSEEKLFEYFDSDKFKQDVSLVLEEIDIIIQNYPDSLLEINNFILFVLPANPFKIVTKPLIG